MDPIILVTNGTATTYTDVDASSYIAADSTTVLLRIVEKSGTLGTQVWLRKNGNSEDLTPYRLIDNGSTNAWVDVSAGVFEYKTDGTVDIYVTGYLTTTVQPTVTDGLSDETFPVSISEIIYLLNGSGPNSSNEYTIFGEKIHRNSISMCISVSNNYIFLLTGANSTTWTTAANQTKIKGAVRDFAIFRLLATLAGVSIPTHYNYSMGGLQVQKPVVSQLKQMLEVYNESCRQWLKILLTRYVVEKQTDLTVELINEEEDDSGITFVSYDMGLV